jgi:hypothetical protein
VSNYYTNYFLKLVKTNKVINISRKKGRTPVNSGNMTSIFLAKIFRPIGQIFTYAGQKCSLNSADFQLSHKEAWRANSPNESEIFACPYHILEELEKVPGDRHRFNRMNQLPLIHPFPRAAQGEVP